MRCIRDERRLVPSAPTRDDRNMTRFLCSHVDDLVFDIQGEGGVCSWDGAQSRCHEVRRAVDEVFVCAGRGGVKMTSRRGTGTRANSQDMVILYPPPYSGFWGCSGTGFRPVCGIVANGGGGGGLRATLEKQVIVESSIGHADPALFKTPFSFKF